MPERAPQFTPHEMATYYAIRAPRIKQTKTAQWRGPCPLHNGTRDSFSIDAGTGRWFCHSQCACGGDLIDFEETLTGSDFQHAKAEIFRLIGRPEGHRNGSGRRIVAEYSYVDESGKLLYQCVRLEPKGFFQRRPDGKGGWINNLQGIEPVLYGLPQMLANRDQMVFIVEGEKDVHTIEKLGLLATCNPMGAGKWRPSYSAALRGREVVILPDNDQPGHEDAIQKATSLLRAGCSVRVVELPGLADKGDVSDWAAAGGTAEQLEELVQDSFTEDTESLETWRDRWNIPREQEPGNPDRMSDTGTSAEGTDDGETHRADEMPEAGTLVTRCVADVEAKPIDWLWPGRIARGKLTIVAGNPGLGKSQTTASIAAIVTTGGCWPASQDRYLTAGSVLILSAEDDPADTLRPRLEAAGADLSRVYVIDGVIVGYRGDGTREEKLFCIETDLKAMEAKLAELGDVAAVMVDPISAYLGAIDTHRNSEVRGVLAPLSEMAARHGAAIIGVSHLTKTAGPQALMRVSGSLAFVAAARAAYLVAADPQDKARRLFLPMKNNLAPDETGLAYRIEGATIAGASGAIQTSRVAWEPDPVTLTADDVLSQAAAPEETSAVREAMDLLADVLADGEMPSKDVIHQAKDCGIAEKTLRRAKERLGVDAVKSGVSGPWMWRLPPQDGQVWPSSKEAANPQDAQPKTLGTLGDLGHLGEESAAAKAAKLNALFVEHGTGGPARIRASTVEDGRRKQAKEQT